MLNHGGKFPPTTQEQSFILTGTPAICAPGAVSSSFQIANSFFLKLVIVDVKYVFAILEFKTLALTGLSGCFGKECLLPPKLISIKSIPKSKFFYI